MADAVSYHDPLMDLQRFFEEVRRESPRAAAILSAVQLDAQLGRMLAHLMIDDDGAREALLGDENNGERPLGTFASRIRAAYAFGLISKGVRQDLELLRRIRNRFAHGHHGLNFEDSTIAGLCSSLRTPTFVEFGREQRFQSPRGRFELAVAILAAHLQAKHPWDRVPASVPELNGADYAILTTPPVLPEDQEIQGFIVIELRGQV